MAASRAALAAYKNPDGTESFDEPMDRYDSAWALVDGTAFRHVKGELDRVPQGRQLYRNSRLLFTHAGRVHNFYAQMVYQGTLSTDGKRLPDGSLGAIPLDPQTTGGNNDALLAASATLWDRWRWSQFMSLRPGHTSILGECLTEMIDSPKRHAAFPQLVWPGFVKEVQLDIVGDVQSYTLEYEVTRKEDGKQVTFWYRKEVDKESFRHFRKDHGDWYAWDPEGPKGPGAVIPNPYGFIPAVWDRYDIGGKHQTSISAIQAAQPALYEFNSFLSGGIDYTQRTFRSPVVVKGQIGITDPSAELGPDRDGDPADLAETQEWVNVSEQGGISILQFDMGQALELAQELKSYVLEMNPEARFWDELRQMTTLTGPGAERALGDAVGLIYRVRGAMDPQTIKLHQMGIAMCGFRYHDDSADGWRNNGGLTKRDDVFKPFTLDSYKAGQLDMSILERPVVPRTPEERIELLAMQERLESDWAMQEAGMDAAAIKSVRDARASAVVSEF